MLLGVGLPIVMPSPGTCACMVLTMVVSVGPQQFQYVVWVAQRSARLFFSSVVVSLQKGQEDVRLRSCLTGCGDHFDFRELCRMIL